MSEGGLEKPRVGISSCLMGERVRYDGAHKRDDWLVSELGRFVEWVPVCPEVAMGLGVPRETLRLEGKPESPRMLVRSTGEDLTERARAASGRILAKLPELDGYIFKKDSPSCGLERVRVYGKGGVPQKKGRGLHAEAVLEARGDFPVIEEGRLSDPLQREAFVILLFAWARFRRLPRRVAELQRFHRDYKLLLMARDPARYAALGKIAASLAGRAPDEAFDRYGRELLIALRKPAVPQRTANALQHMLGYFKETLTRDEKQQIIERIEEHRRGETPLAAATSLLQFLARKHRVAYLEVQKIFEPYPKGLALGPRSGGGASP